MLSYSVSVFSQSWFPWGQMKHFLPEIVPLAAYHSLILTLRKCHEAQIVLKCFDVQTHFSPKIQGSVHHLGLKKKLSMFGEISYRKLVDCDPASEF